MNNIKKYTKYIKNQNVISSFNFSYLDTYWTVRYCGDIIIIHDKYV